MQLAQLKAQIWQAMQSNRPVAGLLRPHARLQPAEQLAIYRDGYHRVLGGFTTFISELPAAQLGHPAAADLCRLEALRSQALVAGEAPALKLGALAAAAATLAQRRVAFVPHLQHGSARYDVRALFAQLSAADSQPVDAAPWPAAPPGDWELVAWRRDQAVWHVALSGPAAAALRAARQGAPFAALCACFVDAPDPVTDALQALGAWFADGWVTALQTAAKTETT